MAGRRDLLGTAAPVAVAALALAVAVLAIATFSQVAPYVGFLDLVRSGLPALALAAGALAVALLRRGSAGVPLLALASCCASAPALSAGLQQRSGTWVLVAALTGLLAPAVVALAAAFPDGHPSRRRWSALALPGAIGVTTLLALAVTYDPAAWGWCRCVSNPLGTSASTEVYLDLVDISAVGRIVVLLAGLALLAVPWRHRTAWSLGFVTTYAVLALTWSVSDVLELRELPTPGVLDGLRDTALTALPLLYVAGFTAQRPSRAHVADLLLAARDEHHPGRLRDLVARAIGDPDAVVGWWDSRTGVYLDHRADVVPVRDGDALRVEAAGRPIAVVSSRRLGDVEQGVRDSVAQALLLAAENRRLTAELEASLEQVRDSRARILTASDDTRRRIERDLHDGAQQLLISTGIKLNLAAAQAGRDDPARLTEVIEEAQAELNRALAELRNLATGIAPTSLVHGSLANALRELALRSAVPTTVRVTGEGQPDQHTASTVYFVVAECLANVAKHADASRATVELVLDHPIRLAVSDDGRGGATFDSAGTGLRGLVDRVEALGGRLDVVSGREGTVVGASIPQGVAESAER